VTLPIQTSGEWREERLYVMRTIEQMQEELRNQSVAAAVLQQTQMVKAEKDIHFAYERIRSLESVRSALRMKNWIMTAVLSFLVTVLFELLKPLVMRYWHL
jgi:ABC-type bacteriocin/lantibiotic exporter with double-glycine peptidase domain